MGTIEEVLQAHQTALKKLATGQADSRPSMAD